MSAQAKAAEAAEVTNFQLTPDFVDRLAAFEDELQGKGISPGQLGVADSIEEAMARMDAIPDVQRMLSEHGLTDRQYCIGKMNLVFASMGAWRVDLEGEAAWQHLHNIGHFFDNIHAYLAHQAEWDRILQRAVPVTYARFQKMKAAKAASGGAAATGKAAPNPATAAAPASATKGP